MAKQYTWKNHGLQSAAITILDDGKLEVCMKCNGKFTLFNTDSLCKNCHGLGHLTKEAMLNNLLK